MSNEINKDKILPPNSMYYMGQSMVPTFTPGDLLYLQRNCKEIKVGDVIVFKTKGDEKNITHRVISAGKDGIKTRGDNNNLPDSWLLGPEDIIGKVIEAERNGVKRKVSGSAEGYIKGNILHILKKIKSYFIKIFRPLYLWLSGKNITCSILQKSGLLRIISIKKDDKKELQLLLGSLVRGRLLPGREKWHIRRPLRLLVDEKMLKKSES
ncbi:MAG: signal peptidase I [Candidatus Eremiobacterota bacterium]